MMPNIVSEKQGTRGERQRIDACTALNQVHVAYYSRMVQQLVCEMESATPSKSENGGNVQVNQG